MDETEDPGKKKGSGARSRSKRHVEKEGGAGKKEGAPGGSKLNVDRGPAEINENNIGN